MKISKNEFSVSGRVKFMGGLKQFAGYRGTHTKREVILSLPVGNRSNEISFEFLDENTKALNNVRDGDWVNISFRLRGRRHIQQDGFTRWFTSLEGIGLTINYDDQKN